MEITISGIKCDNCDYANREVTFEEYPLYVNRPCPRCGNNLLTEKEYEQAVKMYNGVVVINKINKVLRWLNPFFYVRLLTGVDCRIRVSGEYKFPKRK